MALSQIGYNYPQANGSIITTDSTSTNLKPGVAHYVGETQPLSAQIGDIWTSSAGIKRWDGTKWNIYVAGGSTGTSNIKAGTVTFSGASTTITFSSPFSTAPVVIVSNVGNLVGQPEIDFRAANVSASSFSIAAFDHESGSSTSGTFTVNWMAVSNGVTGATCAGIASGTTDSSGYLAVTFPNGQTYSPLPVVVGSWLNIPSTYEPAFKITNITSTGFKIYLFTSDGGTPYANTPVSIYWIATPQS